MDERIPVDLIDPAPDNPRKKLGDLSELVASIRAQGVLQAVSVEPMPTGRYMLVAGHRRLAAAKKASSTSPRHAPTGRPTSTASPRWSSRTSSGAPSPA